jgi:hypothetical protein
VVTFQGIMGIDEGKKAVLNMDARAQQIPAPATAFARRHSTDCAAGNPIQHASGLIS